MTTASVRLVVASALVAIAIAACADGGEVDYAETEIVPEPYQTTKDLYLGSWLGLHTEVVIDRATGTVESTLVEID